jgi:acetylornithine deacetylase/succinyl-diaminopimelate desuccinylase-like protein
MMKPIFQRCFTGIFLLTLWVISCSDSKRVEKDPIFDDISAMVSSTEIENTISDLVAFETRWPYRKQIEAADYLYDRLKLHLTHLNFHEYEFWGVDWKNVVGTIPGKINPEQYVIVSAHLDTKSEKRLVYAPGADDNASGCAAVVELARILSKFSFEKSIKFVIFSREEYGLQGSAAYLKSIDRNKENIIAAINLDMIAYGKDDEDIDLVTQPKYAWLVNQINDLARLSGITAKKIIDKHCY